MSAATILVVDDEVLVAEDIRRDLLRLGYTVPPPALSAQEALSRLDVTSPDLVLMDIRMPGTIDGIEAAQRIRSHYTLPVVYLTAYADEETLRRAKHTVPMGYLVKPYAYTELRATIETVLHNQRTMRQQITATLSAQLSSAQDPIVAIDRAGSLLVINNQAAGLFGYREEDLHGRPIELLIPEHPRLKHALKSRTFATSPSPQILGVEPPLHGRRKDCSLFPLEIILVPLDHTHGPVLLAFIRDISGKGAPSLLRDAQVRLRTALYTSPHATVITDGTGSMLAWNREASGMFGYCEGDVLGQLLASLLTERSRETCTMALATAHLQPDHTTMIPAYGRRKDGSEFSCELLLDTCFHADSWYYCISIRNVGGPSRDDKYQATQLAVGGILIENTTPAEGTPRFLESVGKAFAWELGLLWLVDQAANVLRAHTAWPHPAAEKQEFVAVSFTHTVTPGSGLPGRVWANGAPVWVSDIASDTGCPRATAAAHANLHAAVGFPVMRGQSVIGVLEFFGHEVLPPDDGFLRLGTAIGSMIGQYVSNRRLTDQLAHADKMSAIRQFSGMIAHDFNNLLTVINGYTMILQADVRSNRLVDVTASLNEIGEAGQRANSLTNQLLAISGRRQIQMQAVDINKTITMVADLLKHLISKRIKIVTIPYPEPCFAFTNQDELEFMLMDLALIGQDAMPSGGTLTFATHVVEVGPDTAPPPLSPGAYVTLRISDTGLGMSPETTARCFEPFPPTNGGSKDTGLRLAMMHGFLHQCKGHIMVESEPGSGTTFTLYLPKTVVTEDHDGDHGEETAETSVPVLGQPALTPQTATVLVAEDEPSVRKMACRLLEQEGYFVLQARDGAEALAISARHSGPIHVLVTDIIMPGLNGIKLAERLMAERPGIKVVLTSGYTGDVGLEEFMRETRAVFLPKTYDPQHLLKTVQSMLLS